MKEIKDKNNSNYNPVLNFFDNHKITDILSKYKDINFTSDDIESIHQISFKIAETFNNKRYILNWQEPYMDAMVMVELCYNGGNSWYVRSYVWCRKPEQKTTYIPKLNDDTVGKWIVDFIVKYRMYRSDSRLNDVLVNGEI